MARRNELSPSIGDYLKAIVKLSDTDGKASTSRIAAELAVSSASVSEMVRRLKTLGFVEHEPYKGVRLTDTGRREAMKVLRRHRLWELFLVDFMQFSWDSVHEHAERLEHATDDTLEERLSELLGDPEYDPHGHPIPRRDGTVENIPQMRLTEFPEGAKTTLLNCVNEEPAVLRFLESKGLTPGTVFTLREKQPFDGPYVLEIAGRTEFVSPKIADMLLVMPME